MIDDSKYCIHYIIKFVWEKNSNILVYYIHLCSLSYYIVRKVIDKPLEANLTSYWCPL